jgi:Ca2+-binding EF-hand superfamily protein
MTRTKSLMFGGAALAATLTIAAFAQPAPPGHGGEMGMPMPMTRAGLQDMIAQHFKAMDANGDGFVTKAEFDAAREAMHKKMEAKRGEHRAEMFAMLDKNHDGSLSKDEYMAPPPHDGMMGHDMKDHGPDGHDMPPPPPGGPDGDHDGGPMHGHRMMMHRMGGMGMDGMGRDDKWFDRADANHDGKLTLAEASAGPLAMFDRADTNHDGTISPDEHKAAMEKMRGMMKDRKDKHD